MANRNFQELLSGQFDKGKFLCVGLDPDLSKIPESLRKEEPRETIIAFNRAIIDATVDIAGLYKPNSAFFEAHGVEGFAALRATITYIHKVAPELPVILDAKRADIGNTNQGYVQAAFVELLADAVTVPPYLGSEALAPFLDQKDKGIFVLCRTSNPGAGELQDLVVEDMPLYQKVAELVAKAWNTNGNCGLVVGATYPEELTAVRALVGTMPILIPGIGAQNGDLEKTVRAGKDANGKGMIISASRAILYASSGPDFAEAAQEKALEIHRAIGNALVE